MITKYDLVNKINRIKIKELYDIFIENYFINYPDKIKEKDKIDNEDNFNKWSDTILNTKSYEIITYTIRGKIVGFLSFSINQDKLWISEVQISNIFKNRGLLKKLLKEFVSLDLKDKYNEVYAHINSNNNISQVVFKHIGFKEVDKTIYTISFDALCEYVNS